MKAGNSVIALVNGDEATQTPVQAGLREDGWVEVEGTGLKEGDVRRDGGRLRVAGKNKNHVANSGMNCYRDRRDKESQ